MGFSHDVVDDGVVHRCFAAILRSQIRQKLQVAVAAGDGGEVQSGHLPAQRRREIDDGLQHIPVGFGTGDDAVLADALASGLELGLYEADHAALPAQDLKQRREDQPYGDEGQVHHSQRRRLREHGAGQRPGVDPLHARHPWITPQRFG